MAAIKVTLTLPDELLASVDRCVTTHPGATRSGVCAGAIADWLRDQQETEIARYYQTLSAEERAEDAAWAALAARDAGERWP